MLTKSPGCGCGCGRAVRGGRRFLRGHNSKGHIPIEQRFWALVKKTETCWLWRGYKDPKGYGVIRKDGRFKRAHRASWELANGPIPDGLTVCHNCPDGDNRGCVNPAHLWLGDNAANNADMIAKGRMRVPIGERVGVSRLDAETVRAIRAAYANHEGSLRVIALQYGVTKRTIHMVVTRRTWRHVQ